jgi:dTDP-4-dehydrorhamnose reductase
MKKKIYIAGSGGMLGEAFYENFKNDYALQCTDIDVNTDWLDCLDFRNYDNYVESVSSFKPDYLFHLGALTDLEYCEINQENAYQTNTTAVHYAVDIANNLNIPLLYISTAGIFDGKKDKYDDWDVPNPLCVYAQSKYEGEKFVQAHSKEYLICRPGWMMGGGPNKDKKFIQKIMSQIKKGATELFIVDDKLGTPTYTHDFAKNVRLLLENENWGLYNMACSQLTSRIEVAKELLNILGLDKDIKIIPVGSDYWKKTYFVTRPDSERLINAKLDELNMNVMRDWKICLREYVSTYYRNYLLQ